MLPDFSRLFKVLPDFSSFISQLQGYQEGVQNLYGNACGVVERQKALGDYLRAPKISFSLDKLRGVLRPPDIDQIRRGLGLPSASENSKQDKQNKIADASELSSHLRSVDLPRNVSSEMTSRQSEIQSLQERIVKILPSKEMFGSLSLPSELLLKAIDGIRTSCRGVIPNIQAAFKLPSEYQRFVSHQLKEAEREDAEICERRILVVGLSSNVMELSQISNEIAMTLNGEMPQETDSDVLKINVFSMLDRDLAHLYEKNGNKNVCLEFLDCLPVRVNSLGAAIVELVYRINQYAQRTSGDVVFKPTNKTMYACMQIPNLIADNENDFGLIVDHLFYLIYEGTGAAKRLVGKLKDDQLDPLWRLKHLRLGYRHDVEHGDKIAEKEMQIGTAYRALIKKPAPVTDADWKKAQLAVYEEQTEMLKLVREKQEQVDL